MSLFPPAPQPTTRLGAHRILSSQAGVRVSPLCLGAMNFGDAWNDYMGKCDKQTSFEILDFFYESGGNFIDTANNYQQGQSETWIGEWLQEKGIRDQFVIATKYTTNYQAGPRGPKDLYSNYSGNSAKSLHLSVEASLKKLKTDYIDLLYVHWWDMTTGVPELMQSLNRLVLSGKVLYLGVSDTPAWIVAKANQYARDHGMAQFCVYQGLWNVAERDLERDILPMAEAEGMAVAPWGVLGRGAFRTEQQRKDEDGQGRGSKNPPSEKVVKISKVLESIAEKKGTLMTSVAMAYVMTASPYRVFPIVGGRKVEHLKANIEALSLNLTPEEMKEIEDATDFSYGFPFSTFLAPGTSSSTRISARDNFLTQSVVHLDMPPKLTSLPGAGM